jgi:hypothetical protein
MISSANDRSLATARLVDFDDLRWATYLDSDPVQLHVQNIVN